METRSYPYAIEMRGIVKRFGPTLAGDHVDLAVRKGDVHALLGENGAGKSTLMRILYGLYHADSGEILVDGRPAVIRSPKDAIAHGIGMVTQHFALASPLTVTENIILGRTPNFRIDMDAAHAQVQAAAGRYGLEINPRAVVGDLAVGQRQRVEILKALYREARVLILDEPTAVLTPQETHQLFTELRRLQQQGLSVIFISHKLHEVMAITNRITVLRHGRVAGNVETRGTDERALAQMMVGRVTQPAVKPPAVEEGDPMLRIADLHAADAKGVPALQGVNLTVCAGEIVGLAGVSGNGQSELVHILSGTGEAGRGAVRVGEKEITHADARAVMAAGVGRIPEDRHAGVVGDLSVEQNLVLEHLDDFRRGGMLDHKRIRSHARALIDAYQIKAAPGDRIRTLSGGNMQKVILARVLERAPAVIIVAQPTRGLDIGATEYVRRKLVEQRSRGAAILLISEDLDEIMELSDRIAVIYEGRIMGELTGAEATTERLGLLMSGVAHAAQSAEA
ncbi:MAG: ABC transporter ATP-binding protein [Caldilineaceae bacterium]|nr:ABC transporter ATP-binding protein [Caldilineaceae bacterium]